jgi:hypothetical protein
MWSDTLLLAERAHLMRLVLWGASSVLAGTGLLTALAARRAHAPFLTHFAIQTAAWGAVDLVRAAVAWRHLAERDLRGATRLANLLWLNTGLDVGYIGAGATLAVAGWVLGRRLGAVGGGVGIIVQGAALLVLDVRFLAVVSSSL